MAGTTPVLPTLCGLRRRGYTPTSIFTFVREAGISKSDNLIDMRQLEACIRSELDLTAQRRIAVLDPVKLVVDNYPADKTEYFDIANNPNREANDTTTRKVAFTRELWIENEDFAEVPPPKFKRLTIGGEVRLMGAYIVKCESVEKNPDGSIAAIHCTADLETGNGNPADGRKVKGTIHWVSADHAVDAEVRLYDKLFTEANMNAIPEGSDYKDYLNPESVVVRKGCKLEESLKDAKPGEKFQFVRTGFFTPGQQEPRRVQPRGHPARQLQARKVTSGPQTSQKEHFTDHEKTHDPQHDPHAGAGRHPRHRAGPLYRQHRHGSGCR